MIWHKSRGLSIAISHLWFLAARSLPGAVVCSPFLGRRLENWRDGSIPFLLFPLFCPNGYSAVLTLKLSDYQGPAKSYMGEGKKQKR